jgi:hypothetical protein
MRQVCISAIMADVGSVAAFTVALACAGLQHIIGLRQLTPHMKMSNIHYPSRVLMISR